MYKFTSRIRYSETDVEEKLKPEAVIDYFQDCSSFQSEDLGVGFGFMRAHHVAWIVNYWQIDFLRRPSFGETVRVGTSPYGFKGFIGLRNFLMETENGEPLVIANSVWSLFDLKKGVPVRVLPEMVSAYELFPKFDMEYLPRKIRIPETSRGGTSSPETLQKGISPENCSTKGILVTEDMLDSNGHVNNGQYVRIAMNIAGNKASGSGEIHRLRVEYLAQAHLGDVIVPEVYSNSSCENNDPSNVLYSSPSCENGSSGSDGAKGDSSISVSVITLYAETTRKPYAVIEIS